MADKDIITIYNNSFGISFKWKRTEAKNLNKVQLVFENTGLFLNYKELLLFEKNITDALKRPSICNDCKTNISCKSILLETPVAQISFAMSYKELNDMYDLVNGTLFQLGLDTILQKNTIHKL